MVPTPPRVLAIAGSDSGGGAGIQADLKTMLALGVHGMTVVSAVTAQNSIGVQGYWELPPEAVTAQLSSVLGDIGADAVKTGMLASATIVTAVCDGLSRSPAPLVVDPVAVSKHGDSLLSAGTLDAVRERLLPLATVVTPNLLEAELLTGMSIKDEDAMLAAARVIGAMGPRWVLVKGGHLPGDPVDLLFRSASPAEGASPGGDAGLAEGASPGGTAGLGGAAEVTRYPGQRIDSRHTHGTGCTLASAIASWLALGRDVPGAVESARDYVSGAIAGGFALGGGIGPVDHAWRIRTSGRGRLRAGD